MTNLTRKFQESLNAIQPTLCDTENGSLFNSEEDYFKLSIELLKESACYQSILTELPSEERSWTRDEAIIVGNMVRLYKLNNFLLEAICERQEEKVWIFARLIFETIVNLIYLMKHQSSDLFDSYLQYSLQHEKKLYERLKKDAGNGLPIVERILLSIENAFKKSEIDMESNLPKKLRNWGNKSFFERAQALGLEDLYLTTFSGPSHAIHGNWQDLLNYHLTHTEYGFLPELEFHQPSCQILFGMAKLITELNLEYCQHIFNIKTPKELMEQRLWDLKERIKIADVSHEIFLQSLPS